MGGKFEDTIFTTQVTMENILALQLKKKIVKKYIGFTMFKKKITGFE